MCVYVYALGTTRVIHKHSFLSRFLFIDLLPPTPSLNLTLFIRLRPSVNSCLSLSLSPSFFSAPPFLHFQSTTEQTTVPGNASISSYDPIARPLLLSDLPRALLASLAFTLLD